MTIFDMRATELGFGSGFADDDVMRRIMQGAFSPTHVRAIFDDGSSNPIRLHFNEGSSSHPMKKQPDIVRDFDLSIWPIFSHRAYIILLELGAFQEDFYRCEYDVLKNLQFYMHVPQNKFDIIDIENSTFNLEFGVNPVIHHGIKKIALRNVIAHPPPGRIRLTRSRPSRFTAIRGPRNASQPLPG